MKFCVTKLSFLIYAFYHQTHVLVMRHGNCHTYVWPLTPYKAFKEFKKTKDFPSQFDILQAKPKHTFQNKTDSA